MKFNFTKLASLFVLAVALIATGCSDDSTGNNGNDTPSISSISPASGAPGTSVTINGSNFASSTSGNTVTFSGDVEATVNSASATQLGVTVPSGAQTGPVTVTVGGQSATSSSDFTVESSGGEVPQVYQDLPGNKSLIAEDVTWSSDTTVAGPHYVLPGVTLTVEAGVTVTFEYHDNNADDVGTIITLPGDEDNFSDGPRPSGRLVAQGDANNPIVFTSDRKRVASWGGIILAGEASNNIPGGVGEIEGLPGAVQYGADINGGESFVDNDDSGILSYVRIEYSGYSIDEGSELQALTLYSVGSSTQIDHVNLYLSVDDGIELFGGTVDVKYLVAVGAQDDTFDYDTGWTGRGQFWLGVQLASVPANRGFENDGCDDTADCDGGNGPTNSTVHNVTMIGNNLDNGETIDGMRHREGLQGSYNNVILANFGDKLRYPVFVESDAEGQLNDGSLEYSNIISYNNPSFNYDTLSYSQADVGVEVIDSNEPMFNDALNFDFSLVQNSPALTGATAQPSDDFFDQVDYRGAFGTEDWTQEGTWVRFQ